MESYELQPPRDRGDLEPSHASILAMILAAADRRFSKASPIDGIAQSTVMAGGWAITVREGTSGSSQFGLYSYCHPRHRCVGCSFGCSTENHLLELSMLTGGAPVLSLETGIRNQPSYLQAQVWLPSSPALSGNWVPVSNAAKLRMELAWADGITIAIIEPGGSLAMKSLTLSPQGVRTGIAQMVDHWTAVVDEYQPYGPVALAASAPSLGTARIEGAF